MVLRKRPLPILEIHVANACNVACASCSHFSSGGPGHRDARSVLWPPTSICTRKTHPDLSGRWDRYLAYEGLSPDCTDAELDAFLAAEEEPICGMCPTMPERFDKPSPLRSEHPTPQVLPE